MRDTEKSVIEIGMEANTPSSGLADAVKLCGGQKQLADKIGVAQSTVWYWLGRTKKGVPAEYVARIVDATGGKISAHELRPDVFAAPRKRAPAPTREASQ